ncbi:peptidyl-prolyl cis-trans isomerase, cyclophilin-type family protein [Trichomonas vaginalis G3]|uniref:peptidylprolyl isomerase n=1 Tax=Trichomonas vaginalis (strain ATCC PRA-98 / G3) TaxID=412133 RepID=A2DEW6_TRIV3|nr:peptidyl-prolyl cis-trans isomerase protein [Trichomonas vaginalis G3]EAY20958.1 peptidyl-prolyl cis-trans isomerase, cyclophilin-type family protein [Trichomonas vaginalis G3]KAI5519117.1 peptidyl-prolyl cis-trans isomerase protein [Trichomonas vaginalis G3]|eukprot:XP_001581944.1 peptidyl-prolyl cis-trans isomerase, cyclophilin-type family protein [Trichomonas vaginalis G3]
MTEDIENNIFTTLPSGEMYYRSYMHRENLQFVASSQTYQFFITMSVDGFIKFWHADKTEIEFVKQIQPHEGQFCSFSVSEDDEFIAIGTNSGKIIICRIQSFEMLTKVDFGVRTEVNLCYIKDKSALNQYLAVSLGNEKSIKIVDPFKEDLETQIIREFTLNSSPITSMCFSFEKEIGLSVDKKGMITFWDIYGKCPDFGYTLFQSNFMELMSIKGNGNKVVSSAFSNNGRYFIVCCSDWTIREFDIETGKIVRRFSDELDGSKTYGLDTDMYNSRVNLEKQCRENNSYFSAMFDRTDSILIIPSAFGIKFYDSQTGTLLRIIGRVEMQERFNSLAFLKSDVPMLLASAFNKQRFYLFTNENGKSGKRDAFNEKVTEEVVKAVTKVPRVLASSLPRVATLHTMMGDIKFEMFPEECPLTVENFVTHSKRGYYDNTRIFRVERDFCIQMGDPTGSGIGGESIWGGYFDDENLDNVINNFSEAWMVGMANEGKNTNGSQFFITTNPAPSLNGKHTCWGRLVSGKETIQKIMTVEIDKYKHPLDPILIVNITFSNNL